MSKSRDKSVDVAGGIAALFPALAGANNAAISRLIEHAQPVRLDAGKFVFSRGDSCDNFLLVLDGIVRVQLSSDSGREVTLYRVQPGGSCTITTSCLIGSESYPAEAITESEVLAIAVPNADFQYALDHSHRFRQFVFDGFATRLTKVIQRIDSIVLTSIDQRLASMLLRKDSDGVRDITHQYLAVELGTAREVISRKLKKYESKGLLQLGRGSITIVDRDGLRSLASPEYCG